MPCWHISHPGTTCLLSCRVIRREHGDPLIEELNPGDALEPEGRGTGEGTWGLQPPLLCLCPAPAQDEGKRTRAASSRGLGESLGAPGWKQGSQRSVWGSGNPWAVGSLTPGRDRKERLRSCNLTLPLLVFSLVSEKEHWNGSPKPRSWHCLTCGLGRGASPSGSYPAHAWKG